MWQCNVILKCTGCRSNCFFVDTITSCATMEPILLERCLNCAQGRTDAIENISLQDLLANESLHFKIAFKNAFFPFNRFLTQTNFIPAQTVEWSVHQLIAFVPRPSIMRNLPRMYDYHIFCAKHMGGNLLTVQSMEMMSYF